MSDQAFSCPKCQSVQPFKSAWMLTRYSELKCFHCQVDLYPIAATVPRVHAFSGLAGAFIGIFFYKQHGLMTGLVVIPVVLLFNCLVGTKTVHFSLEKNATTDS